MTKIEKRVISILLVSILVTGMVLLAYSISLMKENNEKKPEVIHDTIYLCKTTKHLNNLTVKSFKSIVGEMESGGDYKAVSKSHNYFGKYQISQRNIALADYDVETFMDDEDVQEWVMDDLIYEYLYYTVSYSNKFNGSKIFNLDIDTWTILYGCHCIGYPKMKKWLDKPSKNRLYKQMINFNERRANAGK